MEVESLGAAAKRLLAKLDRDAQERANKVSGDRNGPNEFEPKETSGEEFTDRSSGIQPAAGLEKSAGELRRSEHRVCAAMRSPATNADTNRYDFTNADLAVRGQRAGNVHWIEFEPLSGTSPLPLRAPAGNVVSFPPAGAVRRCGG